MTELLETLNNHLGKGTLGDDGHRNLNALVRLTADRGPAPGGRLWRTLNISGTDWKRLQEGYEIRFDNRAHGCWSRSPESIRDLMRTRSAPEHRGGGVTVLISRDFPDDEVVLDIEVLARQMGIEGRGPAWFKYAGQEKEVIVRNPQEAVIIRPEEVCGAWGPDATCPSELFSPQFGEIYYAGSGDEVVIREFIGNDEETGCARIITDDGRERLAIWEPWSGWTAGAAEPDEPDDTPGPG